MKKLFIIFLLLGAIEANAQFGVSFHQSNIPFIGVNYEFSDIFKLELRPSVDYSLENGFSAEGVVLIDLVNNKELEFYAGVGGRGKSFSGVVIPIGLNFYPLTNKKVGFHMELAPIMGDENILRGSWGIRYRFLK